MNWASEEGEHRPSFNQIAVDKGTVTNPDSFRDFVALYDLSIIQEEDDYYILDGRSEDLKTFYEDWNWNND